MRRGAGRAARRAGVAGRAGRAARCRVQASRCSRCRSDDAPSYLVLLVALPGPARHVRGRAWRWPSLSAAALGRARGPRGWRLVALAAFLVLGLWTPGRRRPRVLGEHALQTVVAARCSPRRCWGRADGGVRGGCSRGGRSPGSGSCPTASTSGISTCCASWPAADCARRRGRRASDRRSRSRSAPRAGTCSSATRPRRRRAPPRPPRRGARTGGGGARMNASPPGRGVAARRADWRWRSPRGGFFADGRLWAGSAPGCSSPSRRSSRRSRCRARRRAGSPLGGLAGLLGWTCSRSRGRRCAGRRSTTPQRLALYLAALLAATALLRGRRALGGPSRLSRRARRRDRATGSPSACCRACST